MVSTLSPRSQTILDFASLARPCGICGSVFPVSIFIPVRIDGRRIPETCCAACTTAYLAPMQAAGNGIPLW